MTRTLILMRHAKAAAGAFDMDDIDRPLTKRGKQSAGALGTWLVQKGYVPDVALVSAAQRTQETWDRVSHALPATVEPVIRDTLYLASADRLLSEIRQQTGETLLVIAHNPGIADCAARLLSTPPQTDGFQAYPTGATTIVAFEASSWADIDWATGTVRDFTIPRDLMG